MINKPPLHDMMKNLYFLYQEGHIKLVKLEEILMTEYGIDDFEDKDNQFSCIQYIDKIIEDDEDYEIKSKTTIWI